VATKRRPAAEPLAEYVQKRDFAATPEPKGRQRSASKTLRFVVQKHRATRLHYDFRLEANGVLASWAIPKGPPRDPKERRLAMHVEDHPYEYRTFEGIIPTGNYGAGEVIVWDEGTYRLAEGTNPAEEIADGKIKFILNGTKLHGMWTLVKIKPRPGEHGEPWLIIKDHDEYADPKWDPEDEPQSVRSGKTLADIKSDAKAKTWKSSRPAARNTRRAAPRATRVDPLPRDLSPMLAIVVEQPFDDPDWLFEVKWDGYRALATIDTDRKMTVISRNGLDLLARFPDLAAIGDAFDTLPVLFDGEICVLDERGRSSFQGLQSYEPGKGGLTFIAFDLLYADGRDLRALPLEERKARLEEAILPDQGVLYSQHVIGAGKEFFALAKREGLEGIIGKRRDAPYVSARSRAWVKIKAKLEQEFVIGGWTEPRGSRAQFGALLLGYYDGPSLVYAGHVGTGFDAKKLRDIGKLLRASEVTRSPFASTPKTNTKAHFVTPELVAEIAFGEWTRDGILRHPVFLGLRVDKDAREVTREP
jgi:bifunctional non-homologous end joining protein LigD